MNWRGLPGSRKRRGNGRRDRREGGRHSDESAPAPAFRRVPWTRSHGGALAGVRPHARSAHRPPGGVVLDRDTPMISRGDRTGNSIHSGRPAVSKWSTSAPNIVGPRRWSRLRRSHSPASTCACAGNIATRVGQLLDNVKSVSARGSGSRPVGALDIFPVFDGTASLARDLDALTPQRVRGRVYTRLLADSGGLDWKVRRALRRFVARLNAQEHPASPPNLLKRAVSRAFGVR